MAVLKTKRVRLAALISASALIVAATVMLILEIREYQAGRYGTNEGYFADSGKWRSGMPTYLSALRKSDKPVCSLPHESAPVYVAANENGRIVVRDRSGGFVVRLDTLYSVLTERDRDCLDGGVELYSEEALDYFICDFSG